MAVNLSFIGGAGWQFFNNNGVPLAGGKIYTYQAGTTTPLATYTSRSGTIANTNPIILDSAGRTPEQIWSTEGVLYKYVVTQSDNTLIRTWDNIGGSVVASDLQADLADTTSNSNGDAMIGFRQSNASGFLTGAVGRTVNSKLQEFVSVLDFGAVGDGVTDDTAAFLAALTASSNVYVPPGTYCVDASNDGGCIITSGTGYNVFGAGERSIIKRFSYNPMAANFNFVSANASTFIDDVKFSNLKFLGDIQSLGHNEIYGHMLRMSGVRRVVIEKCFFEGPRGDAILLGSGPGGPSSERHNVDVVIRDCVFDGVLYGTLGGRNAISVIDIDGILIEGNSFRNWSRSDMPGTIDFEPDYSFGLVKNVRIIGNKFANTAGTGGHISFACDNIPTTNQQNWIVSNNEFANATNAAVYILTEKAAPSIPSVTGQNIVIANNTVVDCAWLLDKFRGSVNGITITGNIVNGSNVNRGALRMADGSSSFTVTDAIITNNTFIVSNNIPVGITDNIVNLTMSGNVMRGATQAHMRFGLSGSSTTSLVVTGNTLLGTPSWLCQHDATTTNASTNVWRNNYAPGTVSSYFYGYSNDFVGITQNVFDATTVPDNFPRGESIAYVNNVPIGASTYAGIVKTYRHSSLTANNAYQMFWPVYTATDLDDIYFRKAINSTTWGAWFRITGV